MSHNDETMGRQSQQRISNQHKRKFKLASKRSSQRRKAGDQLTLQDGVGFMSEKDCIVCKAKSIAKFVQGHRIPKRSHHVLCIRNSKTKGKGHLSTQAAASLEDDNRHKALVTPITPGEKASWQHSTKDAGKLFFTPRHLNLKSPPTTKSPTRMPMNAGVELSKAVAKLVADPEFCEKHKSKSAPLAMAAFADAVAENIQGNNEKAFEYFNGLTMTVPDCGGLHNNPQHHSIVGQKLLLVDWGRMCGVEVKCPDAMCPGIHRNDRNEFFQEQNSISNLWIGRPAQLVHCNDDGVPLLSPPIPCQRRFCSSEIAGLFGGGASSATNVCNLRFQLSPRKECHRRFCFSNGDPWEW